MAARRWLTPVAFAALLLVTACGRPAVSQPVAAQGTAIAAQAFSGDIRVHHDVPSKYLAAKRDVWVYLPPGYDAAAKAGTRYPVVYMHDGNNVFDGKTAFGGHEWMADESAEKLIRSGELPPFIIVGVSNTADRMEEYTWVTGDLDGQTVGGKGKDYAKFLVSELKPMIDKAYRTKADRANTAVIGSSLGGLEDIYLARYESDTFGKVGMMSPSVWWSDKAVLKVVPQMPTTLKLWLDCGWKEGSDPSEMLDGARDLKTALEARGYQEGKNLGYFEDQMGGHNEQAWAYRLPMAFKFLMGDGAQKSRKAK
jgi:predicted alpha/beta superfamily hydrolase